MYGARSLRWGSRIGGIVDSREKWSAEVSEGISSGMVVTLNGYCYALGSYGTLHAIDLESGKIKWKLKIPVEGIRVTDIRVVEGYLVVEFFVIDLNSHEICADLRDYVGSLPIKNATPVEIHDSRIFRVINAKLAPGKVLVFDLMSKESEVIDIGMMNLCMPDASSILGWKKEGDSYLLSKYRVDSGKLEVVSDKVNLGRLLLEGTQILVLNTAEIGLIDVQNGTVAWNANLVELVHPIDPQFSSQFRISMCDDAIYIEQSDFLLAIERSSGKVIWSRQFTRIQQTCIVGDLLYGICEDYKLFAVDRYTGDEVWSAHEKLPWHSPKAIDNKVLFVSATGHILCCEWDKSNPYHSPARPD